MFSLGRMIGMLTSDGLLFDRLPFFFPIFSTELLMLRMTLSRIRSLFALLAVVTISGCLPSASRPQIQLLHKPSTEICRIAVLPFVNNTDYVQGGTLCYRIFVTELNRLGGFTVAHEGDVRRILRQMKVNPKEMPSYEQNQVLADRLGVEAIITGEVVAMDEKDRDQETDPLLALNLILHAAGSNKPLLTTYHSRRGADYRKVMHFGLINTMTSLAVKVSDEILEIWFAEGLKPCGQ